MSVKKPWERRLRDLYQLLLNCAATYYEPERFRMNVNQFLQTARTVTFIIQKHKNSIQDYDLWYEEHVINKWRDDPVMKWAKDSRNIIEKEGDLEMNSSLRVTLLFSYLAEQDITIEMGRDELLNAGIKKIVRFAQKFLPTAVSDGASVKLERRWVTSSLPNFELLLALNIVYSKMYECCNELAHHLNEPINPLIPNCTDTESLRNEVRHVGYIKLHGLQLHHIIFKEIMRNPKFDPPENLKKQFKIAAERKSLPTSLREAMEFYEKMARITFEQYGNHVPLLFLLDREWRILNMLGTQFEDQAEKFIFWRTVAERVTTLNAFSLIWISEAWIRDMKNHRLSRTRDMPIIGERLAIMGIDRLNNTEVISWKIQRNDDKAKPILERLSAEETNFKNEIPYFLIPAMRAMGLPDPPNIGMELEGSR